MIVNFSVKNFKSIRDEIHLSMVTSAMKEHFPIPSQAFIEAGPSLEINLSAVIYGANASGKSNVLDALAMMKYHVQTSMAKDNVLDKVKVEPFWLSTVTENQPTEFEISFIRNEKCFRYGFTATKEKIAEEWLYVKGLKLKAKEKELFYRENETLANHPVSFKIGKLINDQKLAKENVLVLTLGYQLNDEVAREVMDWFINLNCIRSHRKEDYSFFSTNQITEKTPLSSRIKELIKRADTGITDLSTAELFNRMEILAHHTQYNEKLEAAGEKIFLLREQESAGTEKFTHLVGPILHTIDGGMVLTIDEMDAQLHPNLLEILIRMFQDKSINTKGAQLVFTAHNTNLLNAHLFRRDQVWLTEKNNYGVTSLYSVADYKTEKGKARNKEAIEQNYIDGKYGGVPFLGDFENFLDNYQDEQEGKK